MSRKIDSESSLVGIRKDLAEKYGVEFKVPAPFPDRISIRQALEGLAPAMDDEICKEAYSSRYMSRNRKRGWDSVSFTIPRDGKASASLAWVA